MVEVEENDCRLNVWDIPYRKYVHIDPRSTSKIIIFLFRTGCIVRVDEGIFLLERFDVNKNIDTNML